MCLDQKKLQEGMANYQEQRRQLDLLLLFDAAASVLFGVFALLIPHGLLKFIVSGMYLLVLVMFDIATR